MATRDSALSDLSEMLIATDGTLSTSLAEILTVAVQELIEAELTARVGCRYETGVHVSAGSRR
jgi:hypothetical protein